MEVGMDGGKVENWLANHPEEYSKYPGETIAVVGDKIVAHGKDVEKVVQEAQKYGNSYFITMVPPDEVTIL